MDSHIVAGIWEVEAELRREIEELKKENDRLTRELKSLRETSNELWEQLKELTSRNT